VSRGGGEERILADLIRRTKGAFPGPIIEPNATIRAQLALLGANGVRRGK
jgi:hypothetical protein